MPLVPIVTLEQMAKDYISGKFGKNAKPRNIKEEINLQR